MFIKRKALIAEDIEMNREILRDMLEDDFELIEASNGQEALEQIEKYGNQISVILLDIVMPVMDGFGVLKAINESNYIRRVPVLIISSESEEIEKQCFDYGVADFVRKPFDEEIVKRRVKNNADLYQYRNSLEQVVIEQTKELRERNEALEAINEQVVELLGGLVESRDLTSGEHIHRVKSFSRVIATYIAKKFPEYGLDDKMVNLIVEVSPLHDIGKIKIPDAILLKPGKLTPEEWEIMKTHTTEGGYIAESVGEFWNPELRKTAKDIALYHHERVDGKGYPEGLKEDEIPISAQIVALADVYDALTHERPYKHAFSSEEAFRMITNGECGAFSEDMMDCLRHVIKQLEECVREQD